jgi:hypothetical protein
LYGVIENPHGLISFLSAPQCPTSGCNLNAGLRIRGTVAASCINETPALP